MPRIRVALLGLGTAGRWLHVPALMRIPEIELLLTCDPDERTHSAAPKVPALTDWREALKAEVDAVVIATPPVTHFELADAALSAGLHVYVEKPMTTSLAGAVRIAQRARTSGLILQVGFAFRFHPLWQRVRALIDRNVFGRPIFARGRMTTVRAGQGWGDPVVDIGCHHVDLVSWLTGGPPVEMRATDEGLLEAFWTDGTRLEGEYMVGRPLDRLELEDGRARLMLDRGSLRLRAHGMRIGSLGWPDPRLLRIGRRGGGRPFERALRVFARSARDGRPGGPRPEDGLASVAACEAALRSLASGRVEPVQLVPTQA